jgi:exodeoxyribonuclease VII small subunit
VATRRLEKVRSEAGGDGASASALNSGALELAPSGSSPGDASPGGPASRNPVAAADGALTFEQAIARLGEIVDSLEEGEQPLEESIALFEEGMSLAKSSQEILDRAERRIEELLGVDSQGKPIVREIEPD